DPPEWSQRGLSQLSIFESTLLCQICKDAFRAPVITPCGHTFCSLCMRRCLTKEQACPTCRTPVQESTLKRNILVADIVEKWQQTRGIVVDIASSWGESPSLSATAAVSRTVETEDLGSAAGIETSEIKPRRSLRLKNPTTISTTPPDNDDDMAACPVCNKIMSRRLIEGSHISSQSSQNSQSSASQPQSRLAKLNYTLLNPQSLKGKLSDLGLPTTGPRTILEARHAEWVSLWNANLDFSPDRRRPRSALLKTLTDWERTRKKEGTRDLKGEIRGIDAKSWKRQYEAEFDELIEQAKRS
ncbi:hypothetical protein NADFUDRAFT_8231, partial [Nadsonia fulvescens var. elongata DSM 6958]